MIGGVVGRGEEEEEAAAEEMGGAGWETVVGVGAEAEMDIAVVIGT